MKTAALLVLLALAASARGAESVLRDELLESYVTRFNADDREVFTEAIPNAKAFEFLSANIPLLDCPDKQIERTYYFRWWTFRKHLKRTPDGFVITEFMPKVSWSRTHNTINCAAAHHIREGRWLKDPSLVRDYLDFWLTKGGRVHAYSFWVADSVAAWCDVTGDSSPAIAWLPSLVKNYKSWEATNLDPVTGLFFQWDGSDGMEGSIGATGFRPTINSYMYGDARAIARIAEKSGRQDVADAYHAKAEKLRQLVQDRLWNDRQQFFGIRQSPFGLAILRCRLNDDPALTALARVTASAPGSPDVVKDAREPMKSSEQSLGIYNFARHIGANEWLQFELPRVTSLKSCRFFLFNGGIFVPPEACRVRCRVDGKWQDVHEARGDEIRLNRLNELTFAPVQANAIRLESESEVGDASLRHDARGQHLAILDRPLVHRMLHSLSFAERERGGALVGGKAEKMPAVVEHGQRGGESLGDRLDRLEHALGQLISVGDAGGGPTRPSPCASRKMHTERYAMWRYEPYSGLTAAASEAGRYFIHGFPSSRRDVDVDHVGAGLHDLSQLGTLAAGGRNDDALQRVGHHEVSLCIRFRHDGQRHDAFPGDHPAGPCVESQVVAAVGIGDAE